LKVLLLNLPSPPGKNIERDFAGGFGVLGSRSSRKEYGHDLDKSIALPPLMEGYAAAVTESKGFEVRVLDAQVRQIGMKSILEEVADGGYGLVVSRPCLPSFDEDIGLIRRMSRQNSETKMAVWGTTSYAYLDELVGKAVDYALLGELDQSLPGLCEVLEGRDSFGPGSGVVYRSNGEIVRIPPGRPTDDLDSLPSPAYEKLDMDLYYDHGKIEMVKSKLGRKFFTVQSSRGCPYGCEYCPYVVEFGTKWRELTPGKTVDEIQYLVDKFSIEAIWFRDPTWNFNVERAMTICQEIISRDIGIVWRAEMRADLVTRELAVAMKEAGCVNAQLGLETGSERLLKQKGKKGAGLGRIREGFRALSMASVPITANVMVGLPGDSWTVVRETARVLDDLDPYRVNVAFLVPYPGTKIYDELLDRGWLKTKSRSKIAGEKPVISYDGFSSEDIILARRYLLDRSRGKEKFRRLLRNLRNGQIDKVVDDLGWIAQEPRISRRVDEGDGEV